jgi:hypothetical protein
MFAASLGRGGGRLLKNPIGAPFSEPNASPCDLVGPLEAVGFARPKLKLGD